MLVRGDAPVVAAVHGQRGRRRARASSARPTSCVAGESTKFVMAYTGIGLTPDGSSSWFLPRLVGLRRALELTLTNRVLSADEALEWGLITSVVPDDERARRGRGARGPARGGPARRAGGGEATRCTPASRTTLETHLAREADAIVAASATADGRGGPRGVRREAHAGVQRRD